MDKRKNANLRLLRTLIKTLAAVFLFSATGSAAELYVRVITAGCSKTTLSIKIERLADLPDSIDFSVKDGKTGEIIVAQTKLTLQNGEYAWTGLIPLKDYTASVSFPGLKAALQDKFTNKFLMQRFLDKASRSFQIRNGNKKKESDGVVKPPNTIQDIPLGEFPPNIDTIHVLLIGADNKLAAQYLDKPVPSWNPSAPDGTYKLVIVEYDKNGITCEVKSKRS